MLRIATIAQQRGLNVSQLANKANLAYSQVSKAWHNTNWPSAETLKKIADALDAPVWALFEGAPWEPGAPEKR